MESKKRKRSSHQEPRITYHAADRTFDRLFRETSLQETKDVVRRKLGLSADAVIQLAQLREGRTIDLDDDDDFDAFQALAISAYSVDVRVTITGEQAHTRHAPLRPDETPRSKKKKSLLSPMSETVMGEEPNPFLPMSLDGNGGAHTTPLLHGKKRKVALIDTPQSDNVSGISGGNPRPQKRTRKPSTDIPGLGSTPLPAGGSSAQETIDKVLKPKKASRSSSKNTGPSLTIAGPFPAFPDDQAMDAVKKSKKKSGRRSAVVCEVLAHDSEGSMLVDPPLTGTQNNEGVLDSTFANGSEPAITFDGASIGGPPAEVEHPTTSKKKRATKKSYREDDRDAAVAGEEVSAAAHASNAHSKKGQNVSVPDSVANEPAMRATSDVLIHSDSRTSSKKRKVSKKSSGRDEEDATHVEIVDEQGHVDTLRHRSGKAKETKSQADKPVEKSSAVSASFTDTGHKSRSKVGSRSRKSDSHSGSISTKKLSRKAKDDDARDVHDITSESRELPAVLPKSTSEKINQGLQSGIEESTLVERLIDTIVSARRARFQTSTNSPDLMMAPEVDHRSAEGAPKKSKLSVPWRPEEFREGDSGILASEHTGAETVQRVSSFPAPSVSATSSARKSANKSRSSVASEISVSSPITKALDARLPYSKPTIPKGSRISEVTVESKDEGSSNEGSDDEDEDSDQDEAELSSGRVTAGGRGKLTSVLPDMSSYTDADLDALIRGPATSRSVLADLPSASDSDSDGDRDDDHERITFEEDADDRKFRMLSRQLERAASSSDDDRVHTPGNGDDDSDNGSRDSSVQPQIGSRDVPQAGQEASRRSECSSLRSPANDVSFEAVNEMGESMELDRSGDIAFSDALAADNAIVTEALKELNPRPTSIPEGGGGSDDDTQVPTPVHSGHVADMSVSRPQMSHDQEKHTLSTMPDIHNETIEIPTASSDLDDAETAPKVNTPTIESETEVELTCQGVAIDEEIIEDEDHFGHAPENVELPAQFEVAEDFPPSSPIIDASQLNTVTDLIESTEPNVNQIGPCDPDSIQPADDFRAVTGSVYEDRIEVEYCEGQQERSPTPAAATPKPGMAKRMKNRSGKVVTTDAELPVPAAQVGELKSHSMSIPDLEIRSRIASEGVDETEGEQSIARRTRGATRLGSVAVISSSPFSGPTPVPPKRRAKLTDEERAERAAAKLAEREQKAAAKLAAKEEKVRKREEEKALKLKEKVLAQAAKKTPAKAVKTAVPSSPSAEKVTTPPPTVPDAEAPPSLAKWSVLDPVEASSPHITEESSMMIDQLRSSSPGHEPTTTSTPNGLVSEGGHDQADVPDWGAYSKPDKESETTRRNEPLFELSSSQVPFPFSQWNSAHYAENQSTSQKIPRAGSNSSTESESDAEPAAKPQTRSRTQSSAAPYRRLTDLASQQLFSQAIMSSPTEFPLRPVADRLNDMYGRSRDDDEDEDEEEDNSGSDSDAGNTSHIPKARRAGAAVKLKKGH